MFFVLFRSKKNKLWHCFSTYILFSWSCQSLLKMLYFPSTILTIRRLFYTWTFWMIASSSCFAFAKFVFLKRKSWPFREHHFSIHAQKKFKFILQMDFYAFGLETVISNSEESNSSDRVVTDWKSSTPKEQRQSRILGLLES